MSESVSSNGAPAKGARKRKTAAKAAVAPKKAPDTAPPTVEVNSLRLGVVDRRVMIETAAYYRAERRRFEAGHELEDWLSAEAEIEALLRTRLEGAGREAGPA
jgi:hypothetical protein